MANSAGRARTRTQESSSPTPRSWQPQTHTGLTLRSNNRSRPEWTGYLPEETKSLAAAVDRKLRACCALCLGADPLDPNGLSESLEDRTFVRDRFVLPARLGGGGFRPAVERAQFFNTPNNAAPPFLATERTRGLWP